MLENLPQQLNIRHLTENPQLLGQLGEQLAAKHLQNSGYQVLFRRWRHKRAEVDLVMLDKNCLCLIEVKTRLRAFLDDQDLLATIGYKKKQQLRLAGNALWRQRYELAKHITLSCPNAKITELRMELVGISNFRLQARSKHARLQKIII